MSKLEELQNEVETHLSITISDEDVVWSYNEFSSLVIRIMQGRYGEGKRSLATSVPNTGLDLSVVIPDARNYHIGFEVWEGTDPLDLQTENYFERIHPGITLKAGFFILEDTLYLKNINGSPGKPSSTIPVIILYNIERTVLTSSDDLATYDFEYDQDLEFAYKRYLQSIFFDGKFRPENVISALSQAEQWIRIYSGQAQTT